MFVLLYYPIIYMFIRIRDNISLTDPYQSRSQECFIQLLKAKGFEGVIRLRKVSRVKGWGVLHSTLKNGSRILKRKCRSEVFATGARNPSVLPYVGNSLLHTGEYSDALNLLLLISAHVMNYFFQVSLSKHFIGSMWSSQVSFLSFPPAILPVLFSDLLTM